MGSALHVHAVFAVPELPAGSVVELAPGAVNVEEPGPGAGGDEELGPGAGRV